MTGDEWQEVVEWIADRFPDSQWHAEQAVAYFFDVEDFDASDVWSGVFKLYEQGLRFAPNGSQLLAASRDERRDAAMRDRYRGLPEGKRDDTVSWSDYTVKTFGEELSADDVIRRLHRERFQDCKSPTCDIHTRGGDE